MFELPSEAKVGGGRLGALPIIVHFLRTVCVRDLIDFAVPTHPLQEVTHGECIEAILCAIFLGTHTLFHVEHTLEPYDLERLFQKKGIKSGYFNDTRLGEALDALYNKTPELFASIVARAIEAFQLIIKRLHLDTTSITMYGAYDNPLEFLLPEDHVPSAPEYGKSKNKRSDLKQLVFGMTMTQEGIPICGGTRDGNTSDVVEFRNHMEILASMLKDLREVILVADSKLCTGPTLHQAYGLDLNIVTLLPETWAIRKMLIDGAFKEGDPPLLQTTDKGDSYYGKSYRLPYSLEGVKEEDGTERTVWLRFLVVFSSQLYEQRMKTRLRKTKCEQRSLEQLAKKMKKQCFACEPDAKLAADKAATDWKPQYHSLSFSIEPIFVEKKTPGRKKKGAQPKLIKKFRILTEIQVVPVEEKKFSEEGMFVLLTTIKDGRTLSDRKILEAYKGQIVVEVGFHWLKGPLAVAPVFLKSAKRIEVLGFVYLIAMLVYGLIQRDIRSRLKKRGGKIPYPDKRRTDRPTTKGILRVFENVEYLFVPDGKQGHIIMKFFNNDHSEILELLDLAHLYPENTIPDS